MASSSEQNLPAGTKPKKVLIAIDGSEIAQFSFHWYVDNMHFDSDEIVLVHAVELNEAIHTQNWYSTPYAIDKDVLFKLLEDEKGRIKKKLEDFAQLLKDSKLNGTVKSVHSASPGEGICRMAKELEVDVIVTGSRGLGTLRRTFLGSVSDYILHHSHVPVVVCHMPHAHGHGHGHGHGHKDDHHGHGHKDDHHGHGHKDDHHGHGHKNDHDKKHDEQDQKL